MSYNGFSERLKKLIGANKYTQKETAEKLEISEHSFTKYLNGRIPNAIILHKLATFYNVSMEWLLVGIEMDSNPNNEFETSKNTIGERLKAARKNKNLTLKEIEIATGISTGNLSELENDKKQPSSQTLTLLKKVYGISIDWLLTGENNYTPSTIEIESVSTDWLLTGKDKNDSNLKIVSKLALLNDEDFICLESYLAFLIYRNKNNDNYKE